MARYEHLPIYKQALDVAVHFERVVAGFSRYHKYTLGTELRQKSREVVALVIRANGARDKRADLLALREELVERRYRPGRSVCFVTTRPKLREIFAADFRDRVVHHLLVDHLERIWEPVFIHDSYACRRGKGVHAGVDRLQAPRSR